MALSPAAAAAAATQDLPPDPNATPGETPDAAAFDQALAEAAIPAVTLAAGPLQSTAAAPVETTPVDATALAQASTASTARIDPYRGGVRIDMSPVEFEMSFAGRDSSREGRTGAGQIAAAEYEVLLTDSGQLKLALSANVNSPEARNAMAGALGLFGLNPVGGEGFRSAFAQVDRVLGALAERNVAAGIELQVDFGALSQNTLSAVNDALRTDDPSDDDVLDGISKALVESLAPDELRSIPIALGAKADFPLPSGFAPIEQSFGAYAYFAGQWDRTTGGFALGEEGQTDGNAFRLELGRNLGGDLGPLSLGLAQAYTFSFSAGSGFYYANEQIRDLGQMADRVQDDASIPIVPELPFSRRISDWVLQPVLETLNSTLLPAATAVAQPLVGAAPESLV